MIRSRRLAALVVATAAVAPTIVSSGAGATTIPEEELVAWALEYTGGTAGEATGEPIRFGYANTEALLPEATVGVKAAVAYVNAELGGIGGRPIEIVECQVNTPEDGAACGAQFANDDSITLVLTGVILQGNAEFYEALNGNKPILIGNGLAVEDFVTPAGVSFTAGSDRHRCRARQVHDRDPAAGIGGRRQHGQRRRQRRGQRADQTGDGHRRHRDFDRCGRRDRDRAGHRVGDGSRGSGRGRRVHPVDDDPGMHQRLRQRPVAGFRPGRRDDRAVLRHADDPAHGGHRRGRRLPRRLVLRRLRLQLLRTRSRVGPRHVRRQGLRVRRAGPRRRRRSSTPDSPGRRSGT